MVNIEKVKIGDKVRVKNDLNGISVKKSPGLTRKMEEMCGKTFEVTSVGNGYIFFEVCSWAPEWLEFVDKKGADKDRYNIHGEIDWYRLQKESIESKKTAFVIVKKTEAYLGYIPIAGALWLGGGEFDVEKTMEFTIYKGDRSKIHEMIQFAKEVQKLHKKAKRESEKMSKCPIPEKYEINRVMTF